MVRGGGIVRFSAEAVTMRSEGLPVPSPQLTSFQVHAGSSPLGNKARNRISVFVSRPVSDPVWLIVALVKDPNVRQKGDTLVTQYNLAFFCNVLASWKRDACGPREGIRGGRPGLNTATRLVYTCVLQVVYSISVITISVLNFTSGKPRRQPV